MLDANIEGEAVLRQKLHGFEEARLDAEGGVALGLDEPPDAAQDAVLLQRQEIGLDRRAFLERRMGDHAGEPSILVGQSLDEGGLLEMQAGIDGDFGEHDLVDLDAPARPVEILEKRGALQLRRAVEPAVAKAVDVIEMHMAVDDREVRHRFPPLGTRRKKERRGSLDVKQAARAASADRRMSRSGPMSAIREMPHKPHDAIDLAPEDVEHMRDARFAGDRQAPQMRTPDEAGASAERERDDDIASAPDAAVDQDRDAAVDRLDHAGQAPRARRPRRRAGARHGSTR